MIRTRIWGVSGGLVLLHLVLCIALFDPKIHFGGDSATYMMLAESLTKFGYSLSLEPGPPVPHTKYPAGYPLLLAPLVFLFGRNVVALKLLSMIFTAASVLVFRAYVRQEREALPWFLLALAFAVLPGVIDYSRWMLSEAPFLFFTLLALWMLREDMDRGGGALGRPFWLGLAASVMSFHVRTIGALLLVAGSVSYLLRGEWRRFLAHGSIGAALTIPWLVRTRMATGTTSSYFEEFRLVSIYSPESGYLDAAGAVSRFIDNGVSYATRELPRALVGADSTWSGNALVVIVAVAVCTLVALALVRAFRRRPDTAALYFLFTCLAIMLFSPDATDVRYLVPLLPLFLMYSVDAATWLGERVKHPAARWLAPASVAGTLVIVALASLTARIPANLDMITSYAIGDRHAGYRPEMATFFAAAAWVESNTPRDAVVTVRKPRLFHAVTDRRVRIYPFSTDTDSVLQVVRDTDYVVVDALFSQTDDYLVPALLSRVDEFPTVHTTDRPVTYVLRVLDAAPPPEP